MPTARVRVSGMVVRGATWLTIWHRETGSIYIYRTSTSVAAYCKARAMEVKAAPRCAYDSAMAGRHEFDPFNKGGGGAYRCEGRRQRRVLHRAKRRRRIQICDMKCHVMFAGVFIHVVHYFNRSFTLHTSHREQKPKLVLVKKRVFVEEEG